ncbi:ABC transporter ATP-binding protein [Saccharomonospora azurea]|jgi:iron complex transport system ATP-binding protein|uniref:ABC-type cobalamin/Fe3+-siderophore transport system, ATPase component n=1 Tax=Saccharomonospora azurea NA-128 TaxID=882081 RepID=H8G7T3_9PSEU|nr:ABC transporter ATP-binding protein [Saccharomonospora azurea]EHY87357.1 ABC-type cobalamin/Fe3+-siderophore transport system, ATPase component [Saccharomonospora azurea NA-128]
MKVSAHGVTWMRRGRLVLDDVTVEVSAGSITGLVGPNGSGKTSLLTLMAGLHRPTEGRVLLGSRNASTIPPRERARLVALLEQHATTSLNLTVRQVVELGRVPHRRFSSPDPAGAVVDEAMAAAHIEHLAERSWQTLSGGERQRVQLARALAQQPSALLLDEPTNHLDLRHQLELMRTVRRLGVTVVTALHDLDLAAAYCDRLAVLDAGRLVASGPVDEVLDSRLVDTVYGVRAEVERHPATDRLTVVWHP